MKKSVVVTFMIFLTLIYIYTFSEFIVGARDLSIFSFTVIFLTLLAAIFTSVIFACIIYHDLFD